VHTKAKTVHTSYRIVYIWISPWLIKNKTLPERLKILLRTRSRQRLTPFPDFPLMNELQKSYETIYQTLQRTIIIRIPLAAKIFLRALQNGTLRYTSLFRLEISLPVLKRKQESPMRYWRNSEKNYLQK
jgi:hypothetical protein